MASQVMAGRADWRMVFNPRQWQAEALAIWKSEQKGVVRVVTGGGKTVFAEQCMLSFFNSHEDGQCLIIVPTTSLLDQWCVSLQEEMNVSRSQIGLLGGGEKPSGDEPIIVAVINSARRFTQAFSETRRVMLIVDECHRTGSPENAKALNGNFLATLGLSATPDREYDEGFRDVIEPKLGQIIYEYTYVDAAKDDVIAPFSLFNVQIDILPSEQVNYDRITKRIATAMRQPEGKRDDAKIKRLLQQRASLSANFKMRIPTTVKLVEQHLNERCVIFHERIQAAQDILALLLKRGHRATIYHAGIGTDLRRDNLRLFRKGQFDILVCCKALDEGINVPEASVAVIASSTASRRQRIQRLGRILRVSPGKDSAIIYTIFATEEERRRLESEAIQLEGVTDVVWQTGKVRSDA